MRQSVIRVIIRTGPKAPGGPMWVPMWVPVSGPLRRGLTVMPTTAFLAANQKQRRELALILRMASIRA